MAVDVPLGEDDLRSVVERFGFMPGWEFSVHCRSHEGPELNIHVVLPDAYYPGATRELDIWSLIPPYRTVDDFVQWLKWRLRRIWGHEVDEWARLDGKQVDDPHAERWGER